MVRRDDLAADPAQVKPLAEALVEALFAAEETLREDVIKQLVDWSAVAEALLGERGAAAKAEALWSNSGLPAVAGFVRRFSLELADVEAMMAAAWAKGHKRAVRDFIAENRDRVAYWMSGQR
ncbi:hypothetical protein CKO31_01275 [Thiohalocapsa halophila]|uniref:Uncharacterized protein n=1 Tax=Thiohalocapsa halophila TaxID=69359 RepID=A0ABS1CBU3_9GAMM|nr:hypothetical protein [Thiohalocapsa halophila]MBK1629386.1 hypothetical protein [Thiohalocapsa halophila]